MGIVAAIVAASVTDDVSPFGVHPNFAVRRSTFAVPSTLRMAKQPAYDLDLGDLDFSTPAPAPAPAPKQSPAPKPVRKPKPEKAPPTPKPKKAAPAPKPEKVAPAPKPKAERASKKVVTPPVPPQKPDLPKPKSDPNAGPVGVALGAAPLLFAPVAALAAARGALSKTVERREQIQAFAAEAAAKKKLEPNPEIDSGGAATALGVLGAAGGAAGFAVLNSMAGSGLLGDVALPAAPSVSAPSLPKASLSKSSAPVTQTAPKSKISNLKAPKGYNLDGESSQTVKQQRAAAKKAAEEKKAAAEAERKEKAAEANA